MKTTQRFFVLAIATILAASAVAQSDVDADVDAEAAAQQAFLNQFETIVAAQNSGSVELFVAAIDHNDLLDRIFGLRLIDQKVKKQFQESFVQNLPNTIRAVLYSAEKPAKATVLGFASRGDRGRAVVRFDLPDFQFSYHEYDLRLSSSGRLVIVDWIDFLEGERFTDGVGNSLVMALPSKQAVRKLIDYQNVSDHDIFQVTELLKAARDRRVDKFFEIFDGLHERLQGQRIVVLTGVQLTKQVRDRRKLRTALIAMAKYVPDEPLFSLMLLDYYFPSRMYDMAMQSLLRFYQRLDVDDAATEARLSAAAMVMANAADAATYADRSVTLEPGLELGWWSVLRASVALSKFARAVEALQVLEQEFGHSLDTEALKGDRSFAALLDSDEYRGWLATRQ